MAAGDSELKSFTIEAVGGQSYTTELYPNGRHQCRVNLLLVKEVENAEGNWVPGLLTAAEINSATVTGFGGPTQPLPNGWYSDNQKDTDYDEGLRPIAGEVNKKSKKSAQKTAARSSLLNVDLVELIPRYLRVSSTVPISTQRFMARIVVGGKTYTTNGSYGTPTFYSFVDVRPTPGYTLRAADLYGFSDLNAFSGTVGPNKVDVDVYYFWPRHPALRFVRNLGLENPANVPGEGAHFHSVLAHQIGNGVRNKIGVVWGKDTLGSLLHINDIHRTNVDNHRVEFNRRPTIMRAVRYKGWLYVDNFEVRTRWRLIDNFGFMAFFYLNWSSDRNLVGIED